MMKNDVKLPKGYTPTEDEEYMSPRQLTYFRHYLLQWRNELLAEENQTANNIQDEQWRQADVVDRASLESDTALELRNSGRVHKLIKRIDESLRLIDNGEYGYCQETGEEIGIKRLLARPIATLCVEAKERQERVEKRHAH